MIDPIVIGEIIHEASGDYSLPVIDAVDDGNTVTVTVRPEAPFQIHLPRNFREDPLTALLDAERQIRSAVQKRK